MLRVILFSSYSVDTLTNFISYTRYGMVGLLRPLTVYPSEMVYWAVGTDQLASQSFLTHNKIIFFRTYQLFLSSKVCFKVMPMYSFIPMFLALHFNTAANHKRVKLFWISFSGMFCYEAIPAYIFPLLNGVNVVCLASQKASSRTVDVITNLFGGTNGNEGLGLLSFSFDWQYIGSGYAQFLSQRN